MASATVAQVHRAVTPAGQEVAVKVQHRGARRMMLSDLLQLRLLTALLKLMHVNLGFDIDSIIREYCVQVRSCISFGPQCHPPPPSPPLPPAAIAPTASTAQVPLEFDFNREAWAAEHVARSMASAAASDPDLRDVVVPAPLRALSSQRVLTAEFLRGVPLADAAALPQRHRRRLGLLLVKALGHMILRDGVFHSDPHPGNVLALSRGGDDVQVRSVLCCAVL